MKVQTRHIDISIVIVNYKSWKHLKNCLESLESINNTLFSFEVIVVDNCSEDEQLIEFVQAFPNVHFKVNSGNNGFANGCNFGAQNAQGEYLLFLNPDTIANQKALEQMFEFAKKNPSVGIISCRQKKPNGNFEKDMRFFPSFFTLFGWLRALHELFNRRKFEAKKESNEKVLYPDWVSGSLVFISRNWFDAINGWNEDYWMYFEDVDLSKKVRVANGKVALLKDADIVHNHGGASRINFKTMSLTKTEVLISKHVYIKNHFQGLEYFLSQLLLIFSNLIGKLILSFLGIFLFFIPKMRLEQYIFARIFKYYIRSLTKGTWLSSRSLNYN